MDITPEIKERLEKLENKYDAIGQDMLSYLDGLLYSNSVTYWDYIHLDTLLSLQNTRTDFPDEKIFVIYHQITELYFNLILHELEQLRDGNPQDPQQWHIRIKRCINYFKNLTQSFDVMVEGMDRHQFLKFRMSLLPASGFQSVQYRKIELESTGLENLIQPTARQGDFKNMSTVSLYESLYWKSGNLELKSGKKTLTLRIFEKKYDQTLFRLAEKMKISNLNTLFERLSSDVQQDERIRELLRDYDLYANVFWSLSHYKSAVRYLQSDPKTIEATGGTNWQKFLPPRFQRVIYFPSLWSEKEKEEWGKAWVLNLFKEKVEHAWGKVKQND